MPLRNFGLSFWHRATRTNAGVTWHPRLAVSLMAGLILLGAAYGVVGEVGPAATVLAAPSFR
jgi:TRAP-type C4-dicarboxylate transport system permease small subunit